MDLENPLIFKESLYRPNLVYWVRKTENKEAQLLKALQRTSYSAIVYFIHVSEQTLFLLFYKKSNIAAGFYHAGLSLTDRSLKQEAWNNNTCRVMVATAAFGMGIDKADVALVIHFDLPASLEAYCQESGRAGRNNAKAYALLLYGVQDIAALKQKWQESYPSIEQIKKVYQHLVNYYQIAIGSHAFASYVFDFYDFKSKTGLPTKAIYYSLRALELEGIVQLNEAYYQPSKAYILLTRKELYEFQVAHPSYDLVVKGLLRLYGGALFTPYCTIVEKRIAEVIQVMEAKVYKHLHVLHRMKLIEYLPQVAAPQITFLTPRYTLPELPLRVDRNEQNYQTAYAQLESVIRYITNDQHCRLRTLLDYFNDKAVTCRQCDVCIQQLSPANKDHSFLASKRHVIDSIMQGKHDITAIVKGSSLEMEQELKKSY